MPPISKPPTLASTSRPSAGSGRLTAIARWITPTSCGVVRRRSPCRAAERGRRQAGQQGGDGGRGRGVGDAHVAGAENVGGLGQGLDDLDPGLDARIACSRVIAGPRAMFRVPGRSAWRRSCPGGPGRPDRLHAHVDDHHLGAGDAGQHVDPRQAAGKSPHHLRGHLLGILAHALLGHAVVAGHGDDRPPRDGRLQGPGDAGQVHRQVHQPSQGPMGHDQAVQPLLGLRPPTGILRGNLRKGRLQQVHGILTRLVYQIPKSKWAVFDHCPLGPAPFAFRLRDG